MLRLLVLSRPRVLFCGGQVGRSAVFLAVQLEAVVPFPVAIPQRHCLSPGFGIASIFQRAVSQILECRGGKITGMRSCTSVSKSFGAVVRIEQDSINWPVGDFQRSQMPAKANSESSFIPN